MFPFGSNYAGNRHAPAVVETGALLMESAFYILMEDGTSHVLLG